LTCLTTPLEQLEDGRGSHSERVSVRMLPGDVSVLPSHMSGDVVSGQSENEGLGNPELNEATGPGPGDVEKRLQTPCGQL